MLKILISLIFCIFNCTSFAQTNIATFPDKPVTIVVPFPIGGAADIAGRLIAVNLSKLWGQSVIIANKVGASGILGSTYVARSHPDGYTLLIGNMGSLAINPSLNKNIPYDIDKAFIPIGMISELPFVLVCNPQFKAKSIKELVELAKIGSKEITIATSGIGSGPQIAGDIFSSIADISMLTIPYSGGGDATLSVISGNVDIYFATILESIEFIKSGKLNAIAQSTLKRSTVLPSVPTISESGYSGFNISSWNGLLAPAGTPKEIIHQISLDLIKVVSDPVVRNAMLQQGAIPAPMSPTDFKIRIEKDRQRYAKVIKKFNIHNE